jgi:2-polyprenyl-6-methoxyphenol hydroxylase-like FAD-dependent oxidoreductase
MFVSDREGIRRLRAGGPPAFDAALAATSLVRSVASPRMTGLRRAVLAVYSSALDRRAGDGWVAVGDAAASYDPIAGQGISKALADGIVAAGHAQSLLEGGPPPAPSSHSPGEALAAYRRNRAHVYGLERRFPCAPFWEARRARAAHALSG